jgi:hypothetical protein
MAAGSARRALRLFGIGAAVALAACVAMVLPAALWWLPIAPTDHPIELAVLGLIAVRAWARHLAATDPDEVPGRLARRGVAATDRAAAWALGGGRPEALTAALIAVLLACWVPHYLTWPLSVNHEVFAGLAQSWDGGLTPWRDRFAFQFPGEIYLFWVLGKVFGWGHPPAFFAADAALLLAVGAATLIWSRRRLGGPLPGLIAYLTIVGAYVDLPYIETAERDWHAAALAALGLLAAQSSRGRAGRLASACLTATALAFRPQPVAFVPAILAAVAEQARAPGEPWSRVVRPVLEWCAVTAAVLALAFAPLVWQGLLGDFATALRDVAASPLYNDVSASRMLKIARRQFLDARTDLALAALVGLALFDSSSEGRRLARTWVLALLGALAYRPLHPIQHGYLDRPLGVFVPLALAPALAWVLGQGRLSATTRLLIVAAALIEAAPWWPELCDPRESVRALRPLVRGELTAEPPIGAKHPYPRPDEHRYHYTWADFRGVVDYLKRTTGPTTPVANMLTHFPYPAINGTVGRPSPLPYDSIVYLMWFAKPDLDTPLAERLEWTPDAVIVWDGDRTEPDYSRRMPKAGDVIRRLYRREAHFGEIEVWRRRSPPETPPGPLPRVRLRPPA